MPPASLPKRIKPSREKEKTKGEMTPIDEEWQTKYEKWMKTTAPISPSKKHLSWTSFSDRQQRKGGQKNKRSSGNKEQNNWSCKTDPRRKTKQLHKFTQQKKWVKGIPRIQKNNQLEKQYKENTENWKFLISCVFYFSNVGFSSCCWTRTPIWLITALHCMHGHWLAIKKVPNPDCSSNRRPNQNQLEDLKKL